MAWLEDSKNTTTKDESKDIWLKLEYNSPKPKTGDTAEAKVRILEDEPVGVWRHWYNNRVYNCPGNCPACIERSREKKLDPDGFRNKHRMDYRNYFNVLVDGEVKAFSFGNSVARQLKTFVSKYGDLRDYDVTIMKRKTGPADINVEYTVLYEGPRQLTDEEVAISENRHDLSQFTKPSDPDTIKAAMNGTTEQEEFPVEKTEVETEGKAGKADMMLLKALVEAKGLKMSHLGIDVENPPLKSVVLALIKDLQSEE